MRFMYAWSDPSRWDWFAAGETDAAGELERSARANNSAQRLLFETALILLVPLLLATLAEIVFGG